MESILEHAGSDHETDVHGENQLVGLAGIYVLYSRLLPSRISPDTKFYQKLWALQSKIPIVTLYGNVYWFLNEFLLSSCPCPTQKLKPKDVPSFRRDFIAKA